MNSFKDLFSTQSKSYAQFRPHYPQELFKYLSEVSKNHYLAWDCGTGNGQAAQALSDYFKNVVATDPSEKQLSQAATKENIKFYLAAEENSKLSDQSADLITVAQAFHWFNQTKFFDECERVLKPQGVLAIWSYNLAKISPEVDRIVLHFYNEILNGYWEKERSLVDEGYVNVKLPFEKIKPPAFQMTAHWDLRHFLGYLNTWSAVQTYVKQNSKNPLQEIQGVLEKAWGLEATLKITWPLTLLVSQKISL